MQLISPYREYLRLIREGKVNPEDIDLNILISEFQSKMEELDYYRMYLLSGIFVEVVCRLLKLKTKVLQIAVPEMEDEQEQKKYVKKKVEEILKEYEMLENESLARLFSSYRRKTGRKRGSKSVQIEKVCYKEFKAENPFTCEGVLFNSVDYTAYASVVAKEIEEGSFLIRSVKDFIGLMFAIYLFGIDVTPDDIEKFLVRGRRDV